MDVVKPIRTETKDPKNGGCRRCVKNQGPLVIATSVDSGKLINSIPTGPWPEKSQREAKRNEEGKGRGKGEKEKGKMNCIVQS